MPSEQIRIVVPGDDPPQIQGSPHLSRLHAAADVVVHVDRPKSIKEQVARVADATCIINSRGSVLWPADVLVQLPRLRMITTCSIGTDSIDADAARAQGVVVCNVPGKTAPIVAEHALMLMMATARRASYHTGEIKRGNWPLRKHVWLHGKTLGIIGAGAIGAETARLAKAIGMNVVAWSFHPSEERSRRLGIPFVKMDELLTCSDVVSVHVKLTDQSRGLIDAHAIARMKPGAIVVNTARGAVVDTEALVAALSSGHLGGAGLDVFDSEPLPASHPLLQCEQVVLTPHVADQTPEGIEFLNEGAVDNVTAFLEGRPRNCVNADSLRD